MKLARSSFYYKPKGKGPEQMKAEADIGITPETSLLHVAC
jgi:hypothetical protein